MISYGSKSKFYQLNKGTKARKGEKMSNNKFIKELLLPLVIIVSSIFLSCLVFANGEEDIQTKKDQTKTTVRSYPKLLNYNNENASLYQLKLIIEEETKNNQICFESVIIPYDFWAQGNKMRLPVKVALSCETDGRPIIPTEAQPSAGETITTLPLSKDNIKITLEETKDTELANFIAKLDKEHRYYIEDAFPLKQDWLTYFFVHPKRSELCIKITIIHTGFILEL